MILKPVKKVLFICYGNGNRSIMAEALARHFWGIAVEVWSAGLSPLGYVPTNTLEALDEAGIPTDGLYSKGLSEVPLIEIDYLVNLTEYKIDHIAAPHFTGKLIPFPVPDPFGQDIVSYRQLREQLRSFILQKLSELIGV